VSGSEGKRIGERRMIARRRARAVVERDQSERMAEILASRAARVEVVLDAMVEKSVYEGNGKVVCIEDEMSDVRLWD
jgi:hypothetical protein